MGWVRNDDDMLDHEKWRRAIQLGGDGVLLMWTRFASWSSRRLTDGEVPSDMIDEVSEVHGSKARARQLQALIDAKLLAWCAPAEDSLSLRLGPAEPRARPRARGDRLVVVGYLQRNPTRASVIADRERRAKSQKNLRDKRNVSGSRSDYDPDIEQPPASPDRDNVPSRPVSSRLDSGGGERDPERARAPEPPAVSVGAGGVARTYTMPCEHPPQEYLDEATMRNVPRAQAISTWEHYRSAGLPRNGVERLYEWLCKRATERLNASARLPPSAAYPEGKPRHGSAQPNAGKTGWEHLEGTEGSS
jgi:hypothetical protein